MNLFKHLNPLAFIISFCIGILIVCVKQPSRRIVYRHPNPFNAGKEIYRDNNNGCYKYKSTEVDCNSVKPELIKKHPVNN
jgi:hypothetical protein